jgi:hypothetical protein
MTPNSDLLGAALLGQIGQRGQRADPRAAMAARLMTPQAPAAPIYSPQGAWAHMLTQGLNSVTGNVLNYAVDRDQRAREEDGLARLERLESGRAQEAADFARRLRGGGAAPDPGAQPMVTPAVRREDMPPVGAPATAPEELSPLIAEAAQRNGIPAPLLTALIRQESNFNPGATGRAGEIGLGQIMPRTAQQPGFGVQPVDPAALRDPATNVNFAAQYLAGRGRAAGVRDWNDPAQADRALAAYNGGGDPNYVQNVRRWLPNGQPAPQAGGDVTAASAPQSPQRAGVNMDALTEGLSSPNPRIRAAAEAEFRRMQIEQREDRTTTVAPGSYILRNGQVVGQAPERQSEDDRRLSRWRELQARGVNATPDEIAERDILAQRLRGGGTNVNVSTDLRAEQAEGQARGRSLAEEGERVRTSAETASGTIDSIRQVRALGANTDRLAPLRESIGGYLDAMGVSPANSRLVRDATSLQAFNAAANNVVLGRQLEQKGVQTEGDREVMRTTFATATNTMEANELILRAVEAQSIRAIERAEFYQAWRQQPGENGRPRNTLDGAAEAWNRTIRETPMVSRTRSGIVFLHEWLPAAAQDFNGDQEAALRLWRERARQR